MDTSALDIAILLIVLLFSMSIHEMMHAFTADWLGDPTAKLMGRVTLNPIKHIDPIFTVALPLILLITGSQVLFGAAKPVQVNFTRLRHGEFGGALVGMIGPITNLVIAIILAAIFNATNPQYGTSIYNFFAIGIMLNVGLFVFNSIPWPPLDGSRLLYAFAPRSVQEVMEKIEGLGMIGLVAFIMVFFTFGGTLTYIITSVVELLAPTLQF